MNKRFFTALLASVALVGTTTLGFAAEAPNFSAIADAMANPAPAAAPVVKDIDFSKTEADTMAYIASIARKVDNANIPFTKLAQQFIWGNQQLKKSQMAENDPLRAEADGGPYIMVAGYWDTEITVSGGGTLTMVAYVSDPVSTVTEVEVYFNQQPTGVFLQDDGLSGDFAANDSVYGFTAPVPPGNGLVASQILLELKAKNQAGGESDLWPYLTIR